MKIMTMIRAATEKNEDEQMMGETEGKESLKDRFKKYL